ncbi:hypothetical protein HBI56_189160 [Parastagonospora nodorum]|uniref:Uncharacterized protein n=1 Tax=Phaeosphaeria nodorum (strain SN15 / ATCC MYA-4574 / FGSC 10173) TaxID=321614 RepID=A0A7U2F9U5_PHANO|nr:hypothetical protein HBH56_145320 [Parastagonospora nodorum]QRD01337.1 hypothetical protein JI435_416440 [Parastagonospora nodorum SN15]KAH3927798.1 hypothetical protein HBH54_150510 [Parastagonospora nodorum]KAH3947810.1 hypothetical protein HBH53_110530 [Parastagonospora nodorum]KAH3960198.1 hypothetical protein HBH51_194370 [Parastagonospora nodorum]
MRRFRRFHLMINTSYDALIFSKLFLACQHYPSYHPYNGTDSVQNTPDTPYAAMTCNVCWKGNLRLGILLTKMRAQHVTDTCGYARPNPCFRTRVFVAGASSNATEVCCV